MNDWKDEIQMDEALSNLIVLQDENGNDVEFEFLDLLEYDNEEYVVLMPVNDFDGEVVILQVGESDNQGDEQYIAVQDDETLQAVFELFKEKFKDMFNFGDAE